MFYSNEEQCMYSYEEDLGTIRKDLKAGPKSGVMEERDGECWDIQTRLKAFSHCV